MSTSQSLGLVEYTRLCGKGKLKGLQVEFSVANQFNFKTGQLSLESPCGPNVLSSVLKSGKGVSEYMVCEGFNRPLLALNMKKGGQEPRNAEAYRRWKRQI